MTARVDSMRIVIAGGHGQIARRLGRLLAERGDDVVGLVRNPEHVAELDADGVTSVLLDLEDADVGDVAAVLQGADAAVFAAGAGPGSGAARKQTVDRDAAVLLVDAAERAGVPRLVQVSAMGTDHARAGVREGIEEVFAAYLTAKREAEDDLRERTGLGWVILRPGGLTNDPGTGRVRLAEHVERGRVSRDDVAAVLLAILDEPRLDGRVLELVGGDTPTEAAIAQVIAD